MNKLFKIDRRELIGMLIISIAIFFIIAFRKDEEPISWGESFFVSVYFLAACLMNQWIIPRYFYKQLYFKAIVSFLLVLFAVIGIEEFVLEKIFYPDTRGVHFGLLFTIFEIAPILIIYIFFKFAWDVLQKESKIQKLNELITEGQMQLLRNQISPHFLFNNLNNLYSYALEGSPRTPDFVLKLSEMLRYMLYECKDEWVNIRKERVLLQRFVELNEIQLGNRARISYSYQITDPDVKIPPLMLIVFVENAFKHSSSSLDKDIKVDINLNQQGKHLTFTCSNNYGSESNTSGLERGLGLKNVKQRLALVYGSAYSLKIVDEKGSYSVILTMEVKQ